MSIVRCVAIVTISMRKTIFFAHSFPVCAGIWSASPRIMVLETSCTGPPYQIMAEAGGLALLPPRKEKNEYNSTILGVAETCRKHPKKGVTKDKTLIYFVNVQNGKS